MAIACLHFGLLPDTFWDMRPHETDIMAHFYLKDQAADRRKWAWFFGNLMRAAGNWKKPRSVKAIIRELHPTYYDELQEESNPGTIRIKTLKDVEAFEKRFGVKLLPDARP